MISSEKESSLDVFSKILSDPKSYDDLMNGKNKIELRRNYWVNLVSGQIVTFEPAFLKGVFLIKVQLNGSKGYGTTYFLDEIINEVTDSFKRDLLKGIHSGSLINQTIHHYHSFKFHHLLLKVWFCLDRIKQSCILEIENDFLPRG